MCAITADFTCLHRIALDIDTLGWDCFLEVCFLRSLVTYKHQSLCQCKSGLATLYQHYSLAVAVQECLNPPICSYLIDPADRLPEIEQRQWNRAQALTRQNALCYHCLSISSGSAQTRTPSASAYTYTQLAYSNYERYRLSTVLWYFDH